MGDSDTTPSDQASAWTGDHVATSVLSTLLAGPVFYGLVGWGLDALLGTSRVFLPIGVIVGCLFSFYIVYMRYGRGDSPQSNGSTR